MLDTAARLEDLDRTDLARFVPTVIRRIVLHNGIWFNEVLHQLGLDEALVIEENVAASLIPIVGKHISGVYAGETTTGLPALAEMPSGKLIELVDALCKSWLASDGVWFQAVESRHGMDTAKRCNDTCWTRFSPLEAGIIKSFLGMPPQSGLEGLRKALGFRLYARLNRQTSELTDEGLVFRMTTCRVQEARKRRGLPDYPCKSAGLVEYTAFARAIDSRIRTECIACPPDDHPADWSCAWRFSLSS